MNNRENEKETRQEEEELERRKAVEEGCADGGEKKSKM